jgi:hypothetical protein
LATIVDNKKAIPKINTSYARSKLTALLFYHVIQNQAKVLSTNPFGRGSLHWIGLINIYHAMRGDWLTIVETFIVELWWWLMVLSVLFLL